MFLLRLLEELMLLITLRIEFCVEIGEWSCLNKYKNTQGKRKKKRKKKLKKCKPLFIFYFFPNNSVLLKFSYILVKLFRHDVA